MLLLDCMPPTSECCALMGDSNLVDDIYGLDCCKVGSARFRRFLSCFLLLVS